MSHYDEEREAFNTAQPTNQSKIVIPFEWEDIDDEHQRAKVHGGWLVKAFADVEHFHVVEEGRIMNGWDWRIAMTFVPDPTHEWKIAVDS